MKKFLVAFLFFSAISFAQTNAVHETPGQAIIRNIYPLGKKHHSGDTIKAISYPVIYNAKGGLFAPANNIIKAWLFNPTVYDTTKPIDKLFKKLYKKDKSLTISYKVNRNKSGFLSLTINRSSALTIAKAPLYLNIDLNAGKRITLKNLLKTKNDSISLGQAIVPQIADSIRNFEQTINKNNPQYSDIIEQLNSELATFTHSYQSDFIMTDKEIIICFDCILPSNLLNYNHTYKAPFNYKVLRNIFKTDAAFRLQ